MLIYSPYLSIIYSGHMEYKVTRNKLDIRVWELSCAAWLHDVKHPLLENMRGDNLGLEGS